MFDAVFQLSPRITILPILHGSGDMAQEVRERLVDGRFDCLAVPLPPSAETALEDAIEDLPRISVIAYPEPEQDGSAVVNFIPVDPCQAVIMGIRVAMSEEIPRAYVDRDVMVFEPLGVTAPDPYALKKVPLASYLAALLPTLPSLPRPSQRDDRIAWMAFRLHELELDFRSILCLCHVADWPWLRDAYRERRPYPKTEQPTAAPRKHPVRASTLYFTLGELPFITQLYEQRRARVVSDRHVAIDGIKELLLETRTRWRTRREQDDDALANWVTPQLLQAYLQYVRNLALISRRLTPDLYTLVLAAKQVAGDDFAVTLLETAKSYVFQDQGEDDGDRDEVAAGIGKVEFGDGRVALAKNRLPGAPQAWRTLTLRPHPRRETSRRSGQLWNPFRQCSWPPEDDRIESFTGHVREQARAILGADLARVEKFTTSFKDGIDLRESLRHWYGRSPAQVRAGRQIEIYVKEIPPARGNVEAVVFLFDTPADPEVYSWKATWYAEHAEESTLCFYATPFQDRMVGPGIAQSRYGGALFLFPPRAIPNVWEDPRLASARTLEEKLLGGAALHSREPHLVLVSPRQPPARWRRLVREFRRQLVVIPLSRFSGQVVDRLRRFHVLNGHDVRSFAAKFIREM